MSQQQDTRYLAFADGLQSAGISKLVLHAWERRYALRLSERTTTGRRYFTGDQVERLRLLKLCTEAGHRIGNVVHLSDGALRDIAESRSRILQLSDLLDAIERLDVLRMRQQLSEYFEEQGAIDFGKKTVAPLMNELGKRWTEGRLSVAAEHMASAEIRLLLSTGLSAMAPPALDAPRAIITTPQGEIHELGALLVTLIARSAGLDALYFGPNLPNAEIIRASGAFKADVVCLSCISKPRAVATRLADLRRRLPQNVALWLGGSGLSDLPSLQNQRYFSHVADFEEAAASLVYQKISRLPN